MNQFLLKGLLSALTLFTSIQFSFSESNLAVVGTEFYGATRIPDDLGKIWDINAGGIFVFTLKNDNTPRGWTSGTPFFFETARSLTDVVDIEVGDDVAIALHSDGSITSWDYNSINQDVPTRALNPLTISSGGAFFLALMPDGSVEAWGNNDHSQLHVPTDMGHVVQIEAGENHAIALNSKGKAWSWGFGLGGQLPMPENSGRLVRVAAGLHGTVGVTEFGKMIVWDAGKNFEQAPNDFSDIIEATTSGLGWDHVALRSDGTVKVWEASNRGIDKLESETGIVAIDSYGHVVMGLKKTGDEVHDLSISGRVDGDFISVRPNKTQFDHGEQATITAFPPIGKYFSRWKGVEAGRTNPLILTLLESADVQPIYLDHQVSRPMATPSEIPGTFNLDLALTTATADATIYYTLDGSDPNQNSTLYTGPVSIADTQLLKAFAVREHYLDSQILEYTYQTVVIDSLEPVNDNSDAVRIHFEAKQGWLYSILLYDITKDSWVTVESNRPGTGSIDTFVANPIKSAPIYRITAQRQ